MDSTSSPTDGTDRTTTSSHGSIINRPGLSLQTEYNLFILCIYRNYWIYLCLYCTNNTDNNNNTDNSDGG